MTHNQTNLSAGLDALQGLVLYPVCVCVCARTRFFSCSPARFSYSASLHFEELQPNKPSNHSKHSSSFRRGYFFITLIPLASLMPGTIRRRRWKLLAKREKISEDAAICGQRKGCLQPHHNIISVMHVLVGNYIFRGKNLVKPVSGCKFNVTISTRH